MTKLTQISLDLDNGVANIAAMACLLGRMSDLTNSDGETVNQTAYLIKDRAETIKDILENRANIP